MRVNGSPAKGGKGKKKGAAKSKTIKKTSQADQMGNPFGIPMGGGGPSTSLMLSMLMRMGPPPPHAGPGGRNIASMMQMIQGMQGSPGENSASSYDEDYCDEHDDMFSDSESEDEFHPHNQFLDGFINALGGGGARGHPIFGGGGPMFSSPPRQVSELSDRTCEDPRGSLVN